MIEHYIGSEAPAWGMWCRNSAGLLIDLGSGTFTGRLFDVGTTRLVQTLAGTFTGAAGAGVEPTGTPNLTYTPANNEMTAVEPGVYMLRVRWSVGDQVVFEGKVRLHGELS